MTLRVSARDFLAELVRDRIARLDVRAAALRESAGTGTLDGNLATAPAEVFGPLALGILGLVIAGDALRARLRATTPTGLPVLTEAAGMIGSYLRAERDLGRVAPDADVDTLALTLIGTGHLLFAGREGTPPGQEDVRRTVSSVVAGVVREV
ncbi:TetR/AcrR family transcriptional regulator [Streptomyces sp. NPDC005141]